MGTRAKLIVVLSACAASISGAVVFIFTRLGRHATTAAKVAATSGVVATVAAPVFLSDKVCLSDFGQFAPEYCQVETQALEKFGKLFAQQQCDEAVKLFEKLSAERQTSPASLVKTWLLAAHYPDTPEASRKEATRYITEQYSMNKMGEQEHVGVWGVLVVAELTNQPPGEGLEYAEEMLRQAQEFDDRGREVVGRSAQKCLDYLMNISEPNDGQRQATSRLVEACAEAFPPGSVRPEAWSINLHNSIMAGLMLCDDEKAAVDHYKLGLKKMKEFMASKTYIQEFVKATLRAVQRKEITIGRKSLEEMLVVGGQYLPSRMLRSEWGSLLGRVANSERRSYALKLLDRWGASAAPVVPFLLTERKKSVPVREVVRENLGLMSYEIEASIESRSLEHLINQLRKRNIEAEIDTITEFLWHTFPTNRIGVRAFDLWLGNLNSGSKRAFATQACREMLESYDGEPIALKARRGLAAIYISEGQVIEGLLLANEQKADVVKKDVFTASALGELLDEYVKQAKTKVERQELLMGLAEQLRAAGQNSLAIVFYSRAATGQGAIINDPRTGLPPDASTAYEDSTGRYLVKEVLFWRSLALASRGRKLEATEVMQSLVEKKVNYKDAYLGRVFLAKQYYQRGQVEKAWEYLRLLPEDVRNSKEVAAMYNEVAVSVPAKRRHTRNMQRIEEVEQLLLDYPNAGKADLLIMEMGQLWTLERDYTKAALTFESLLKQYPESELCPEAYYRAIMIYRNKILNAERADELTQQLKSKFPQSIHAQLLDKSNG